jgi:hypothetical protein
MRPARALILCGAHPEIAIWQHRRAGADGRHQERLGVPVKTLRPTHGWPTRRKLVTEMKRATRSRALAIPEGRSMLGTLSRWPYPPRSAGEADGHRPVDADPVTAAALIAGGWYAGVAPDLLLSSIRNTRRATKSPPHCEPCL